MMGKLRDFAGNTIYDELNTDKISSSQNIVSPTLIKCPDCGKFVSTEPLPAKAGRFGVLLKQPKAVSP